jgi:hypothetical protein
MKNKSNRSDDDPLDKEIDFKNARPNPYWLGVVDRSRVRLIDEDLAAMYPDDDAVNSALRSIAESPRRPQRPKVSARRVGSKRGRTAGRK